MYVAYAQTSNPDTVFRAQLFLLGRFDDAIHGPANGTTRKLGSREQGDDCLLYTSDAADE